jgi:tetratricopeptide (TPR) repeat protein
MGRLDAALDYYASIPQDGSPEDILAAASRGELARVGGRISAAEFEYDYVLKHDPANALAHERMAFLLQVTGRRWQSVPHLIAILRSGAATREQLTILGDLERPVESADFIRQCSATNPEDVLVQLGSAVLDLTRGRSTEASQLVGKVVDRAPHLIAAQALLGELLVGGDDAAFVAWHSKLPPVAAEYPEIWFVRGLAARRRGNLRVAARCLWETLRLAPTHRRACYQMAQVLVTLGDSAGAEFSERTALMLDLTQALDDVVRTEGHSEAALKRVTDLMEQSGRYLEACAWSVIAVQAFPKSDWPEKTFTRLAPHLDGSTPQTIATKNLALRYDFSRFPTHAELFAEMQHGQSLASRGRGRATIRFEETSQAGIDFVYVNGHDASGKGARMFEQTGGGVAVLDFDGDGWPDLFFPQGMDWPLGSPTPVPNPALTDRLYRNQEGQAFVDITRHACPADGGFGQGCAAGDFDNDGFTDLYIGHVGCNRLHRNNGDGTFSDVTVESRIEGQDWTSSCVVVDLNGDGSPDLFDVTYVTGPDVYERICRGHGCSPKEFAGIPDRLRLSRGDGSFELITRATPETNSKGLGVVAFDVFDRGRPCLFIANDQVPGHFLRNFATQDRNLLRFEEAGLASGLAVNEDGLAMAGMGIAADDANGDGLIDFYVTTFKDEPRILYLQEASGLFTDATSAAGLRGVGLPYVGWGTQFLDADRDGEPDLVVANGHVDDYRDAGGEYHMRPQFLWNIGRGRFTELPQAEAGSFFARKYLGRGLARLDWNRDGLMDFVVSNIGSPASLVTNQSTDAGHFINVRLHATATARDAIGSVVEVVTKNRRWTRQLVAGDGYMASNERLLQFGLSDAATVTEMRVTWTSGSTAVFHDLPTDVTIELVEGARRGILWRGTEQKTIEVDSQ